MQNIPPVQLRDMFEHSFSSLLEKLNDDELVQQHKDEIFEVWFISPFIKRVCLAQPIWLQSLLKRKDLQTKFSKDKYVQLIDAVVNHRQSRH